MSTINVVCPHCLKINRLPRKEHYKKANCGYCKQSLLENKPVEVDAAGFSQFVQNSDLPLVVDFWAPWCGPCRMMAPAFAQAAASLPLKAQFIKVNTEENPQLSAQYGIRSIPTMILFKNGREVDRVSGALSADQIVQWVARYA
ncbi:thioredoxin TrxC [Nitratifractor sp.]|uniref:thioredoxin TrxC n=1 Tax=Nitratifractor sp. TaxID=2268144 RepID=UPI0025CF94B7|nr:thioredoxin TrxC [Nitratifractor sp.]